MKIRTRINPYTPENYFRVTITIGRDEAVSFSMVASEIQKAVAEASDNHREFWGVGQAKAVGYAAAARQVLPKGYFGDEDDEDDDNR